MTHGQRIAVAAWLLLPALAAAAPRRAGVVDARPLDAAADARSAAEEALARRADVAVVSEPGLRSALVGVVDVARIPALATDCAGPGDADLVARLSLAPLADVKEPVTRLLARQLVCADGAGDRGAALAAARRLSALGSDGGVSAEVWSRYPAVDATVDVLRQPLAVTTDPPGASVTIDLAAVSGPSAIVSAGHRLVAAAAGERAAATFVDVKEDRAAKVTLTLPAVDEAYAPVRAAVRKLRTGGDDVAAVARAANLDVIVVLRPGGAFAFARDGEVVRPLGSARLADGPALLALLPAMAPAPAPVAAPAHGGDGRSPWIYVIAAGAAAAAVGLVVLATSSGSTTQRIEVKWP
jgi:hypothetical protein